jgi:hypothetical protein
VLRSLLLHPSASLFPSPLFVRVLTRFDLSLKYLFPDSVLSIWRNRIENVFL